MTDSVTFTDESKEHSVRRKAEYDDSNPHDLVLTIAKREGGQIAIPLLKNARSNIEREDYQENTLLRIKPLAEIESALPISTGYGAPVFQGKAVAMLRPGYLYIFRRDRLWRELEIGPDSKVSDVDLAAARKAVASPESNLRIVRPAEGEWLDDVLVPVFLQGQGVMHDIRMAYSEVQWDWGYVQKLEADEKARNARTTGVGHAWAVTKVEGLSFQTGFPASRVEDLPELRARDLGVELMLESPRDFNPEFEKPSDSELCAKLAARLREAQAEGEEPIDLDIRCDPDEDRLAELRGQKGLACVALPDPLFKLRHSLAQLQLALHYLDAIDVSIKDRPLVHSAMLIRQALFDPKAPASSDDVMTLRAAVDQEKLNKILEHSERRKVLEKITVHMEALEKLLDSGEFDVTCGDYLNHKGLGPCEAFSLHASLLDLTQQIPGVLSANGLETPTTVSRLLKLGLGESLLIEALAGGENANNELSPMLTQLKELARKQDMLTGEHLNEVGLSSIGALALQVKQEEGDSVTKDNDNSGSSIPNGAAGRVAGMVQAALGGWSGAVLKAAERLRESGDLTAIKLDRVFTSVAEVADIADPNLGGELRLMSRGAVDLTRYSIVGMHGKGLSFGLTDADLRSEALTRRNDYLFADRANAAGKTVASTSPARLADEIGEAAVKAAAHAWVFVLPVNHPEALKFSAFKFDWANKAKAIADGPGLSRVLVGLAVYNLVSEIWSLRQLKSGDVSYSITRFMSAGLDLSTALMKLHIVSSPADNKLVSKAILRPLFEVKSLPIVGPLIQKRLVHVGASTIVRSMSLVNFFAGSVMVGVSAWDYRNSVSSGDLDAAIGHGLAVAGGSIFVVSNLMSGLLAVPGWGWALFGLGLVVGGSVFAAIATDSQMERVLKQGPLGLGPSHDGLPKDDAVYYPQLLSVLSPVSVSAKRFGDLSDAEKAMFADHNPSANDYRVTVTSPLISRFKLGQKTQKEISAKGNKPGLRLGVQELEYTHSTIETSAGQVDEFNIARKAALKKITTWVALPEDNAVHFLIERDLAGGETQAFGRREQRAISLRVVLQARIESEIGTFRFPMPVLDDYESFDAKRHEILPDKTFQPFNPFKNDPVPYWLVKEVTL
ncbi:hypothetical protein SAMN04488490_1782 [Marinobacter sp. LV10R510-11A]|uniref:toxin VasX n=1 Tax=Marinobacter sp. LV10R510-11A TaxID=1415568 RepID=UPI000BB7EC9B|nr:toxin VasX [Marinobacter sp. LV10R510-11A]SOB76109.1 hypothetical protein SAMN04488490_1782 [Marinobacter sp. LV10R510-11A]